MVNMSYCRFENTLGDLRDCYENMEEELTSESEVKAKQWLINLCRRIAHDYSED